MNDIWAQMNQLFDRLADATPAERALILEVETGRAPRLRRRLELMLASHDLGSIDVERAVHRAFAQMDRPPDDSASETA